MIQYCFIPKGGFPDSSVGKETACNVEDPSSIPGSRRSPGEGIGYPLQYSWASLVAKFSSVAQSCPTLCDPLDCSLPGSSAWGFSRQEYWRGLPCPSPRDFPNPGIDPRSPTFQTGFFTDQATREAPKYWSGQPIPSPGDLLDPGIKLGSPALQADSLPTELSEKPKTDSL